MEAKPAINSGAVEIRHFSHPQHSVHSTFLPYLYTCDGCKEYGAGGRYRCNLCDIDIHEFCARAPPSIAHPSHAQHPLIFHAKPGSAFTKSKCGVCGEATKGFAFRCFTCQFSIHPCCAQLPQNLKYIGHSQHALQLLSGPPCAARDGWAACNLCGRKGSGWVYHCAQCDFYLHALCAKAAINGLQAQGIVVPAKPSKFGRAARFATHVLQGFIGGLVEGLGEGVADVLLDNIGRDVGMTDHSDGED